MKSIIYFLSAYFVIHTLVFSQANYIQSIDFDSKQRVVYGLSGPYDSSYTIRYSDGIQEICNLTAIYGLPFYYISTAVDNQDNIWAFMGDKLYHYDNLLWKEYAIPSPPGVIQKYSDLSFFSGFLWLTCYTDAVYNNSGVWRFNLIDSNWKVIDPSNSNFPDHSFNGTFFHSSDTTWLATSNGLVKIVGDSADVILDTTNSVLQTQLFYSFYIDSNNKKWIGSMDKGIIKWINNSTFTYYNSENSNLPNNFINAIAEDSEGRLWLGTDDGFACLDSDSIISYHHFTDASIATLAVDHLDNVWMGKVGTGELLVFDGTNISIITDVNEKSDVSPVQFFLLQNYPNPFNPETTIEFFIPKAGFVELIVYDLLGSEIRSLLRDYKNAGVFKINFNAEDLTSGIYIYTLSMNNKSISRKMLLIK